MQSNYYPQAFSITTYYWGSEVWNCARHTQRPKSKLLEIGSRNLDGSISKLKLCRMTSTYLGKICVHFLRLTFSKCNEIDAFHFYKKIPFESDNFLLCSLVALDKVYSKQLRSYNPANRKKLFDFNKWVFAMYRFYIKYYLF